MSRNHRQRQQAERRGRLGEWAAILVLFFSGWRIVAHRFRTPAGEIDIIARRGQCLALVEVKVRASRFDGVEAVTSRNRRRIEQAGRIFLAKRTEFADFALRYDILVIGGGGITWLKDAWRGGE